jgi:hypothetical protein
MRCLQWAQFYVRCRVSQELPVNRLDQVEVGRWLEMFEPTSSARMGKTVL